MLAELEKSQQTAQAVLDPESDPAKKQWNADAIGIIDREKDLVRSQRPPPALPIWRVPERRALFDRFPTSLRVRRVHADLELGGHPGLIYRGP